MRSETRIDARASIPLYEQVAAQIRRDIAEGQASPGERLTPAKDMTAVAGVNTNTVLRAPRLHVAKRPRSDAGVQPRRSWPDAWAAPS